MTQLFSGCCLQWLPVLMGIWIIVTGAQTLTETTNELRSSMTSVAIPSISTGIFPVSSATDPSTVAYDSTVVNGTEQTTITETKTVNSSMNQPQFDDIMKEYWTFNTGMIIYKVYPILFFCLGLIGNGISLALFLQPEMRKYASFMYLATLAVFNQFALTMGVVQIHGSLNSELLNPAFCKITAFFTSFSLHVSVFCIVLATIQCLIVVTTPMKAAVLCTRKRALIAIFSIIVIFIGINMHLFWTMELSPAGMCVPRIDGNWRLFVSIWSLVDASLYSVIPVIFFFIANTIIGVLMHFTNKQVRRLTNEHYTGAYNKHITVMQLTVSTFFLICATPVSVLFLYRQLNPPPRDNPEELAKNLYVNAICNVFYGANHTFNIFLYFLSGRRFRVQLKKLLTCATCRQRHKSSSSSAAGTTLTRRSGAREINRQTSVESSIISFRASSFTSESGIDTLDRKYSNDCVFIDDNPAHDHNCNKKK